MRIQPKRVVLPRPDYLAMLAVVAVLLAISVIAGIIYTYADSRQLTGRNDISGRVHNSNTQQLPADL
jgi:hypothetical protein